jgi:hypothetical protein
VNLAWVTRGGKALYMWLPRCCSLVRYACCNVPACMPASTWAQPLLPGTYCVTSGELVTAATVTGMEGGLSNREARVRAFSARLDVSCFRAYSSLTLSVSTDLCTVIHEPHAAGVSK